MATKYIDKTSKFAVLLLTHGRPDKIYTLQALKNAGYTGKIYLVIDDKDPTADQYFETYGDMVFQFNKDEAGKLFDHADNFNDHRTITYARTYSFYVAEKLGLDYFIQLDDDYTQFAYRFNNRAKYTYRQIKNLDKILEAMVQFIQTTPAQTITMSQGGDFIGGEDSKNAQHPKLLRKAMNSFVCRVDRKITYLGRMNEDVSTYVTFGQRGLLFFTTNQISLQQKQSQSTPGGITELYKAFGTYVKSFYSILFAPSCITITLMGNNNMRLHHNVHWRNAVPKILHQKHKK